MLLFVTIMLLLFVAGFAATGTTVSGIMALIVVDRIGYGAERVSDGAYIPPISEHGDYERHYRSRGSP